MSDTHNPSRMGKLASSSNITIEVPEPPKPPKNSWGLDRIVTSNRGR
jgi:hypothetical protein